jgi:ketosteroid isomerase-like protein
VGIRVDYAWASRTPSFRLTHMTSAVLQRLIEATNQHDLEALTACFAPEFVNETPAHPDRSFTGRDQVRQNWAMIFRAVPDVELTLVSSTADGDFIWAELEFKGSRADGARHWMRGVTIFGVKHDLLASVRFYVEPVQTDGVGVAAEIRQTVMGQHR